MSEAERNKVLIEMKATALKLLRRAGVSVYNNACSLISQLEEPHIDAEDFGCASNYWYEVFLLRI